MKKMNNRDKVGLVAALVVAVIVILIMLVYGNNLQILNPKGTIASQQRDLLVFAALLSLVVVLPVFFMTGFIAYKYRASNKKARYTPEWDNSNKLEAIWWGVPILLITILSVVTYKTSHSLDPFRPIENAKNETKTIQVVALQYKWLFIYPDENIATVNYLNIPEDTPVKFEITSDAPMNSFWVPQLGGQIYAMSGMSTELNLMAEEPGTYEGYSANISGAGFSDMNFQVISTNRADYETWVNGIKHVPKSLDLDSYNELARPGTSDRENYSSVDGDLYANVVGKYMSNKGESPHKSHEGTERY
ncbi:ubiquinol oxidase subunit II [Candidatus Saccharibacteria bacterium]|nr:ubiquinol oxidase subunit II [Candidatus Saccharibacteria bacterium]